jgi:CubicO group peptidase (beta-lactamase class C family)
MPFRQQILEWITDPLEMKNTILPESNEHPEINSYSYYNDWKIVEPADPSVLLGAGAVVSTTEDLANFIEGLFLEKLIKEESLAKMTTLEGDFGHGISSFPFEEHDSYSHTGGIDGFQSLLSYFPQEDLSVCLQSNGMNYNYGDITEAIVSTYFGNELETPDLSSLSLPAEELQKYVGEYRSDDTLLEFSFTLENDLLMAHPTGYESAVLSPKGNHTFDFTPVNAKLIFSPEKEEMKLHQSGQTYLFKRK